MTQAWRDLTGTDDGTRLFPDAERAAQSDELADVIRRVIGDEQNRAQICLVALAGRDFGGEIGDIPRQRPSPGRAIP